MLDKLKSQKSGSTKKRVGRGYGSGKGGHTVGRGQKGQKSRSGYKSPRQVFEGAGMPLNRRLPKLKGFSREGIRAKYLDVKINLNDLESLENGTEVTLDNLRELGLLTTKSKKVKVKILGKGKLTKKLTIKGIPSSESAAKMIEKAGGKVINE